MNGSKQWAAIRAAFLLAVAAGGYVSTAGAAACCSDSTRTWRGAVVESVREDTLVVLRSGSQSPDTLALQAAPCRVAAQRLQPRMGVLVDVSDAGQVKTLRALAIPVSRTRRTLALGGAAVALFLLFVVFTKARARRLVLGEDGRYSGSKFQTALWFFVLVVTYITAVALRWWAGGAQLAGGVDVPGTLFALSGISVATFATAKALTQNKLNQNQTKVGEKVGKDGKPVPSFPGDLVNDDRGNLDFGSFQMIVVTLLAVVVYLVRVFVCLGVVELTCRVSLPDVDTTMLAVFGLGQGGYLLKKSASKLGEG